MKVRLRESPKVVHLEVASKSMGSPEKKPIRCWGDLLGNNGKYNPQYDVLVVAISRVTCSQALSSTALLKVPVENTKVSGEPAREQHQRMTYKKKRTCWEALAQETAKQPQYDTGGGDSHQLVQACRCSINEGPLRERCLGPLDSISMVIQEKAYDAGEGFSTGNNGKNVTSVG
jgi:hypothetical protein